MSDGRPPKCGVYADIHYPYVLKAGVDQPLPAGAGVDRDRAGVGKRVAVADGQVATVGAVYGLESNRPGVCETTRGGQGRMVASAAAADPECLIGSDITLPGADTVHDEIPRSGETVRDLSVS